MIKKNNNKKCMYLNVGKILKMNSKLKINLKLTHSKYCYVYMYITVKITFVCEFCKHNSGIIVSGHYYL